MHLQPGDRLDNWEIVDILGEGGMGAVYRARSTLVDDVFVALKVTHPRNLDNARERFGREVKALLRLHHPAIVRVQGFGEDQARGLLWFAMDLVEGHPLDTWVEAGSAFPLASALPMFAVLTEGLAHAHERGVAHRDLKPANVIVRADGTPVMVDFGISATDGEERLTRTGAVIGTPQYLAPEALDGRLDDPMKGDLYAIGQMLFEVIVGGPAFPLDPKLTSTQNALRIMHQKVIRANLDPGEAFPAVVRALTRELTAEEPADRIPTAKAAVARLIAAHEAVASGAAPPISSLVPVHRRSAPDLGRASDAAARSAPTWRDSVGATPANVHRDSVDGGGERDGFGHAPGQTGERDGFGSSTTGERDGFGHPPGQTGERDGFGHAPGQTGEREGVDRATGQKGERDGFGHAPGQTGERASPAVGGFGHAPGQTGERDGFGHAPGQTGETATGPSSRAGGLAMLFGAGLAATGAIAAIGAGVLVVVVALVLVFFMMPGGGRGQASADPASAATVVEPPEGSPTGLAGAGTDPAASGPDARAPESPEGERTAPAGSAPSPTTAADDTWGAVDDGSPSEAAGDGAAQLDTAEPESGVDPMSSGDGGTPDPEIDAGSSAPTDGGDPAPPPPTDAETSPTTSAPATAVTAPAPPAGTAADEGTASAPATPEAVVRRPPPVVRWSTIAGITKGSSDSAISEILGPSASTSSPHCKSAESAVGYLNEGVIVCRTVFGGARRVIVVAAAAAAARERSGDPKLAAFGKSSSEAPSFIGSPQARPSSNRWTYQYQKVLVEFTHDRLSMMVVEL